MYPGLTAAVVALVAAALFALWQRRRAGRLGTASPSSAARSLTEVDLGRSYGERATLVQFSSAFCQPCRATRRVLTDVAAMVRGVEYVEIDAESRLDLVRKLAIIRTPTVLVLDSTGVVARRGTGLPRKADVIAALGEAVSPSISRDTHDTK